MEQIKILVADDEERMRKLLKDFFTRRGYIVKEAADGEEALERFFEDKEISLKRNIFHEVFPVLARSDNEDADYIFREQGRFIVQLVEKGNCVIAGRRADFYLKDNPNALHVFFYADQDFKVERICRMEGCSEEEAAKKIADTDKRRRTSYEYVTGRKWADRHNYSLMLCTSALGLENCAELIASLLG